MLPVTIIASLLPLFAMAEAAGDHPPHMRHRRVAAGVAASFANDAHSDAQLSIKKSINKRGQQCRAKGSKSASSTLSDSYTAFSVSSSVPSTTQQAWEASQTSSSTTSSAWSTPSPSSGGLLGTVSGLLAMTDSTCGYCNSGDGQPNGSEDWLNCGINGGGWTPPHVEMHELIAADLSSDGVFSPCADYIDKFKQYGQQYDVHPIMLASFAMQESGCNAGATGGNGEAGLMQIAPPNCESGNNCWDVDYNIRRGAQLLSSMIKQNNGNVIAAIGSYNGWQPQQTTYDSATAAARDGNCHAQNNLDYLHQFVNGWMQGVNGYSMGEYFNLAHC